MAFEKGNTGFDESKYEEISVIEVPSKNPKFAKSGIEAVIYYYDDAEHKWPPRLSIREFYADKASGEKRRTKGVKIFPELLPDFISVLTKIHERYEERKSEGGR